MNLRVSDIRVTDLPKLPPLAEIRCSLTLRSGSGRVDYQQKKTTPFIGDTGSWYAWPDLCFVFGETDALQEGDLLRCKLKTDDGAELGKLLLPLSEVSTLPTSNWHVLKLDGVSCQGKLHIKVQLVERDGAGKRERMDVAHQLIPKDKILFEGELQKKKKTWDSFRWNSRYFVLSDEPLVLRYYLSESHSTAKGSIPLDANVTLKRSKNQDYFGFAIFTDEAKIRLRAKTEERRERWMSELTKRLQRLRITSGKESVIAAQFQQRSKWVSSQSEDGTLTVTSDPHSFRVGVEKTLDIMTVIQALECVSAVVLDELPRDIVSLRQTSSLFGSAMRVGSGLEKWNTMKNRMGIAQTDKRTNSNLSVKRVTSSLWGSKLFSGSSRANDKKTSSSGRSNDEVGEGSKPKYKMQALDLSIR
jgi:hypothetical protein